jgi:hypothetical protein
MTVQEVQWSDLQRDPKSVAALADQGDVRVKRRDGADLVLTRADRLHAAGEGAVTTARTLRRVLSHDPDLAARILLDEFPWLTQLPVDELAEFANDFVRSAQAAAELGRWEVLAQTLREWKATAAIYTDPVLLEALTRPITDEDEFVPAPSPIADEG